MRIKKLHLQNFRNYEQESFVFDEGLNILFGKNAQGKTNCAEAVFYLCTGTSLRIRHDKQLIRMGAEYAKITAEAENRYGNVTIEALIFENKREIKINGNTVYVAPNDRRYVYSPETAYLITDTLKTAVSDGTARRLRQLPFPVAAKTGTVGVGEKNTDAYTVAYTSEHTIGVWLGNASYREVNTTGGGEPCTIAASILERLYAGHSPEDFEKPTQVEVATIDKYYYDTEQRIALADENAPSIYKKQELFARKHLPKERSTLFSYPTIPKPKTNLLSNGISLHFEECIPDGYGYKILRSENGRNTLVYEGKSIPVFQDVNLKAGTYEYTIIPFYRKNQGKSIRLPAVYFQKPAPTIADKPWWME